MNQFVLYLGTPALIYFLSNSEFLPSLWPLVQNNKYCKLSIYNLWVKILPIPTSFQNAPINSNTSTCLGKVAEWLAEPNTIRMKNVHPTHPAGGPKNLILCFLANMRYIRDSFVQDTYSKKADTQYTSVYPWVKKCNIINPKIEQSACMNAEIESGRGGSVFPPTGI